MKNAPNPFPQGFSRNYWTYSVTPIDASKSIIDTLVEVSGKPVLVHRDPNFAGRASIKIASNDSPSHLLRYKPEFESELPYLSAFQCGMALRSIQAKTVIREATES